MCLKASELSLRVLCNCVIKTQHLVEHASAEVLQLPNISVQKAQPFGDRYVCVLEDQAKDLPLGTGQGSSYRDRMHIMGPAPPKWSLTALATLWFNDIT